MIWGPVGGLKVLDWSNCAVFVIFTTPDGVDPTRGTHRWEYTRQTRVPTVVYLK